MTTKSPDYPGVQWVPSNGTEGYDFIGLWCANCARDKSMSEGKIADECDDSELCEILTASMRGQALQWRRLEDGSHVCVAFVEHGKEIPPPRCTNTVDMFEPKGE